MGLHDHTTPLNASHGFLIVEDIQLGGHLSLDGSTYALVASRAPLIMVSKS